MPGFEQFRDDLGEVLRHLHDPDCQPSAQVYAVLGCEPASGASAVQSEVIRSIESLSRAPEASPETRSQRDAQVLRDRYLLRLTQEETAERANVSVRSMRRAQREATHMLARLFWERRIARVATQEEPPPPAAAVDELRDWRGQIRSELLSLQAGAPGSVADVGQAIAYAVELEGALLAGRGLTLHVGSHQAGLTAAVHPAVLRQILIVAIAQLSRCLRPGRLTIEAQAAADTPRSVRITLRGAAGPGASAPDAGVLGEILAFAGGHIECALAEGQATVGITVPSADDLLVLAIDDNPDMVHFYQRCTAGSRYHVVPAEQGQRMIEAIAAGRPDVVILDIILPDADGWQLLAQLRQHPATRSTPVILCSIVREEDLAQALGAAIYLAKPVGHRELMAALDAAVSPERAAERTSPG